MQKEYVFGKTWVWFHETPGRKRWMTRKWESQKGVATVIPFPSSVACLTIRGPRGKRTCSRGLSCWRLWRVLRDLWNSISFPQPQLWNKWGARRVQRCRTVFSQCDRQVAIVSIPVWCQDSTVILVLTVLRTISALPVTSTALSLSLSPFFSSLYPLFPPLSHQSEVFQQLFLKLLRVNLFFLQSIS